MKRYFSNFTKRHLHFSRFLLVGSFNTFLDFVFYFLLADVLTMDPVLSSIISTGLVMVISFNLNHAFVFRSGKSKTQTALPFVAATLFNVWLVQSLIIFLLVHTFKSLELFKGHRWTTNLLAKLGGVAVSFVLNFIMYRYIFHKPDEAEVL